MAYPEVRGQSRNASDVNVGDGDDGDGTGETRSRLCVTCVMSGRGAGPRNGGSQQGHSSDWVQDQSGVRVGRVRVGADERRRDSYSRLSVWNHVSWKRSSLIADSSETIVHTSTEAKVSILYPSNATADPDQNS